MKHYATYALLLLLSCKAIDGFSQSNTQRPAQFNNFPAAIPCSEGELSKLFNTAKGQLINLSFSNNFSFSGTVTSNLVRYSNLQTAVVASPDYANTIFQVSKITESDGSITYSGRIVNKEFSDGFELKRNSTGDYQLIKIETERVMPDCNL